MPRFIRLAFIAGLLCLPSFAAESTRVILDEISVKNLRLETVETEEASFEETIFSLGHLEILPGRKAVVSSRIAGRAFSVLALPDQQVEEGDELVWVESRQPGDPPPTIMLPAPMAGLISKVDISQGQPITPDQALIEIVDMETLEAAAQVPEHLAGRLEKGQIARIRLPAFPDKVFEAKLAHIGAYADEKNGTVEAAFHLSNEDLLLRPGMRAEFTIVTRLREGVTVIPSAALQGDSINRFVFVKDFELANAFVKASVVIGQTNDTFVEVISGLLPGDEVVTQGAYALAFAGGGTTSLKEALDAAHGHEHNEDGTERKESAAEDHDHDHESESSSWNELTLLFAASTALLLVLLALVSWKRNSSIS
ncbi:RND family efflux transporter MFP subunit [Prosthecobacter fusiformis]|uniref:RND family efflux transporter MFP subunit n=1 Tax=Prosthecobacter fusiformis TaxID=48464 RepID=A0A4R7S1I7_9BACT|nr:efflux RND transporter periplasmic adaptor subunit [Prosthecobacter fusiformis]TDU71065.1 RND family efflux transporter MFP subunit [Prosthecobacter fusiformis]